MDINKNFAGKEGISERIFTMLMQREQGGAFTTIPDAEKFWKALLSYQLFSKEMVDDMTAPQVAGKCYGYGI
jgi:predicted lactoylglutathione lyase